eukprot:524196-Amphidinium_carterae.1
MSAACGSTPYFDRCIEFPFNPGESPVTAVFPKYCFILLLHVLVKTSSTFLGAFDADTEVQKHMTCVSRAPCLRMTALPKLPLHLNWKQDLRGGASRIERVGIVGGGVHVSCRGYSGRSSRCSGDPP